MGSPVLGSLFRITVRGFPFPPTVGSSKLNPMTRPLDKDLSNPTQVDSAERKSKLGSIRVMVIDNPNIPPIPDTPNLYCLNPTEYSSPGFAPRLRGGLLIDCAGAAGGGGAPAGAGGGGT